MAQTQTQQIQTTQIAESRWYKIWREVDGDAVRLIAKYVDYFDTNIYATRIVEISGDGLMRIHTKWSMPEAEGEELTAVKLQPDTAALWRGRIMSAVSIRDVKRIMWELNETFIDIE